MKKIKLFFFVVIALLTMSACSMDSSLEQKDGNKGTKEGSFKIGFSISTVNNPLWKSLYRWSLNW
ncbi:hypothetical protein [Ureibacillus terrenus]|uniref:Uncharacterized protein n=1 Tax=Ureibacillus terrenus TaxID=118246 RepID=A0A540V6G2_9BACL|nr:hypothetical protein [Ureibacillus terrenus]TQE92311.1 hypothetical protein FKZ59_00965 [Ureibacillus terrenus]